jgi:hypothetical protein
VIGVEIMQVFDALWHADTRSLHAFNQALLVLPPKSPEACAIKDFRLIPLIHVIGKLISNALANRLAPRLDEHTHSHFHQRSPDS